MRKFLLGQTDNTNIMLISIVAFVLLFSPVSKGFVIAFGSSLIVTWIAMKHLGNSIVYDDQLDPLRIAVCVIAQIILIAFFVENWTGFFAFKLIADKTSVSTETICFIIGIILSLLCFPMLYKCLGVRLAKKTFVKDQSNHLLIETLFVITVAFICVTFFSKSSPLFPINDWADANVFFTIGKSMLSGKVPYRDLVDHKGPLLFFLHSFAAMISYRSFLGVWVIEAISFAVFLFFSYRLMRLLGCDQSSIFILPLMAVLILGMNCFQDGDSAEELCLPALMIALFYFCSVIKHNREFSFSESLIIGLSGGYIFWIKYSLLGLFVGSYIYCIVLCVRKGCKSLKTFLLASLLGGLLVTVPIILYFLQTKSLGNMIDYYFFRNIFYYGTEGNLPLHQRLIKNIISAVKFNRVLFIVLYISLIFMFGDYDIIIESQFPEL